MTNKQNYYSIFSDIIPTNKKSSKIWCRQLESTSDIKKVLETPIVSYILNNKTNNVLIFDNKKAYVSTKSVLDEYLKNECAIKFDLDESFDEKNLTERYVDVFSSYDYVNHSINIPSFLSNRYIRSYGKIKDETEKIVYAKLRRISWMHDVLISQDGMISSTNAEDILNGNITYKVDNIYTNSSMENLLYKEFFIDKDYSVNPSINQTGTYSYLEFNNSYLTNKLDDYKDKEYGMIINLEKVNFKKEKIGYDIKYTQQLYSTLNPINGKRFDDMFCFIPQDPGPFIKSDYKNNYFASKVMSVLEKKNEKVFKRIMKGLSEIENASENNSVFMFSINTKSQSAFSIFDIKHDNLCSADIYKTNISETLTNLSTILNNMNNIDTDWIFTDAYGSRTFLNKTILKENKNQYKFEIKKSETYWTSRTGVSIRSGRRSTMIYPGDESFFDQLCEAGAIDEDTKNSLKCEWLLQKM